LAPSLVVVFVLAAVSTRVDAWQPEKDAVLVYSDVCIHGETGDMLGDRVVVLRFADGDYAYIQTAEGVMQPPQISKATISNNVDIKFSVSGPNKAIAIFRGKLAEDALSGTFTNNWKSRSGTSLFRLPRIVDRQNRLPECD
jgi:hypothetical protein